MGFQGFRNILVHSDMVNFLLKTYDDRRTNLLFIYASAKTPKRERGESHHPAFLGNWPTIICTFLV